ncbi:MAG: glutamate--tRNA ligase [Chloroflexi bacterium HGW-Chloroflexi-4]|jgi:glutamyl-tRNA synthetase|nr:MAG: glutamate--tRNA ligase [Chloroflexi bacterium HGW-Chloroflexi-4]
MTELKQPARVRFAPSPTGHMHLGSARTALYNYLIARQTGGTFILRIEDTDTKRYIPEAEDELIKGIKWLGLDYDEGPGKGGQYGPYRQSERKDIYTKFAEQLVESGHAYYCFCSPEHLAKVREVQQANKESLHYDGTCREIPVEDARKRIAAGERYVIRFKMPKTGSITVHDHLRGDITVENKVLDDSVLVKSDGWALYHLAAMVDDYLMKITHVIRGSEWLPSLPLHMHIIRAFGWPEPTFIHLSVFLKPSGKGKMSKRETADAMKDGHSIFVKDLEELGYVPEGVVNWTALMGWSYDDHTEFFSLQDLVEKFSIDHLNPSPAAINFTKLDYFNALHIRNFSDEDLANRVKPFLEAAGYKTSIDKLIILAPILKERLPTLDDVVDMAGFFFKNDISYPAEDLIAKGLEKTQCRQILTQILEILNGIGDIKKDIAEEPMRELVEKSGFSAGQVFGIMRVAVTGQKVSPPLFESMEVIGKDIVLNRIQQAIKLLD